jgi:hypothetical protein
MPQDKTPTPIPEIPAGMMRVWDPEQKKVLLVPAPVAGPDRITLTLRLHDSAEKKDAAKSTSWAVVEIPREDLALSKAEFFEKHVAPAMDKLIQLNPLQESSPPATETAPVTPT